MSVFRPMHMRAQISQTTSSSEPAQFAHGKPASSIAAAQAARLPAWVRALDTLPLQARLTVNQPGDAYEQEAGRVAEQVMRMPAPQLQRTCACGGQAELDGACAACKAGRPGVQRKSDSAGGMQAPASVHETLRAPGQPLDSATRAFMEPRFGQDFGAVRVHTGAKAAESAKAVGAQAYTVGQDVVFGAGKFAPQTHEGRRLLAHELTHVAQQSALAQTCVQRQTEADQQAQPAPDMLRIYSFGPTGAGRMASASGVTIFPPAAPVDAEGRELVQAGTTAQPILSRFGRYFTLDERQRPYPPPVPVCAVRAVADWVPDDGSAPSRDERRDDATSYYGPGVPLGTRLGSEYIFSNDRPGVLTMIYVLLNPDLSPFVFGHSVHFVNSPAAPPGATVLPDQVSS